MHLVFRIMSQSDTGSAELGKRRRGPPPPPFSAWQPGDAAMLGQRKKKQRDNKERLKESSRVAKYRESKKEIDKAKEKKSTKEKTK